MLPILRGMAMTYDMADQPRAISGGVSASYQYDGNLKRVKSVADGKTIYNVYDLSGALVHVDEVTDATRTDYVAGPNGPLMRIENGNYRYLHADHLGSAHRVSNASGTILANFEEVYSPYGMTTYDNSANDNQAGFTGHIRDKATGLNYMQARYYDPLLGRFLSVDPVTFMDTGEPEMFNRYAYSYSDPVNMVDLDGRKPDHIMDQQMGVMTNRKTGGHDLGRAIRIFAKHDGHAKSMGDRIDVGTSVDGDKFEHFMANHEVTTEIDATTAKIVSDIKEAFDRVLGETVGRVIEDVGNTAEESARDQQFNEAGREAGEAGLSTQEAIDVGTDLVNTNRADHLPDFEPRNDDEHR